MKLPSKCCRHAVRVAYACTVMTYLGGLWAVAVAVTVVGLVKQAGRREPLPDSEWRTEP